MLEAGKMGATMKSNPIDAASAPYFSILGIEAAWAPSGFRCCGDSARGTIWANVCTRRWCLDFTNTWCKECTDITLAIILSRCRWSAAITDTELPALPIDDVALVDLLIPEEADDTLDMAVDSLLGSQEPAVAGLLLAGASAARKMGVKTVRSAQDLER